MHNVSNITKEEAYDQARKEFYALRQEEEIEARIAEEEARAVGGYFGKTRLHVGMELEDRQYERWKKWAETEIGRLKLAQSQAYTSFGDPEASAVDETASEEELKKIE